MFISQQVVDPKFPILKINHGLINTNSSPPFLVTSTIRFCTSSVNVSVLLSLTKNIFTLFVITWRHLTSHLPSTFACLKYITCYICHPILLWMGYQPQFHTQLQPQWLFLNILLWYHLQSLPTTTLILTPFCVIFLSTTAHIDPTIIALTKKKKIGLVTLRMTVEIITLPPRLPPSICYNRGNNTFFGTGMQLRSHKWIPYIFPSPQATPTCSLKSGFWKLILTNTPTKAPSHTPYINKFDTVTNIKYNPEQ